MGGLVRAAVRVPGPTVGRVVMGALPFAPNRTPVNWLSHDDAEVDLLDVYRKAGPRHVMRRLYEEARHDLVNETIGRP